MPDKLTQAAMLICLLVHFPAMIFPFLFMLVKEIYMSVSGILLIQKTGVILGAEWHGKTATVLLYMMIILHVFCSGITSTISNVFIAAGTVMIAISFVLYGISNTKVMKGNRLSGGDSL